MGGLIAPFYTMACRSADNPTASRYLLNDCRRPGVVAMVLKQQGRNELVPGSDGEHTYLKHQRGKPPR